MAIKKFKIEASEQAKQLAKKPVKASDGEWDKAVISFIDTIPELPEQGKVISKKYKGFPVVIVGLGDGKCLYKGYSRTNDAASDVQFIRGLIKRGDSPEKATANLGFKTYTRGDVEGACGGKKKSIKSAAGKKRWGLYSDFGQRILNETFDSKREAQKAFREYGYTKDSEAWIEEVDETAVGKFDKKPANSACGGKKTVKAGRDKLKARKDWAVDVASRYSLFNGKNGDIENSNNKAELIRKCRNMSDPAWVEDNMLSGIIYNNDAQSDVDNADNPNYKPKRKSVKSSARRPARRSVKAADSTIKRYSDVVPKEDRKYWYFTTHGLGPGMIPRGVNVLKVQEGQNRNGTWGDFILLDAILNTDELKQYDLIELAPKDVNASTKRKPMKKSVKASAAAKRRASKSVIKCAYTADDFDKIGFKFDFDGHSYTTTDFPTNSGKFHAIRDDNGKEYPMYIMDIIKPERSSPPRYTAKSHTYEQYGDFEDYDPNHYDIEESVSKASAAAKRRAKKSVTASKYYEITDQNNNEVGRSDLEDEARELAKKLLRENDEDHYDIWWVDTDPDSTDDTSYIDTVYADKPFSVEGYYEANFRGLSDSDTFYELRDALEYAQELLSKGFSVRMECENAGGKLEITPDEYDEFVQTADGAMFEDMPEVAEWLSDVRAERMDSNQEPWLDNWQYNTDIGMSVKASKGRDYYSITDDSGEQVDMADTEEEAFEKATEYLEDCLEGFCDWCEIVHIVEGPNGEATEDYIDTIEWTDVNSPDIDASTNVKAALGNKNKTDYASNPIYELDKYVKDLAEGVAAAAGITLTYQVSDEAITFIDGDGTAVFIQPISEITPEPDDLENDIQELVSAIQYEDSDNPEYWPTDTTEDDPDYATRAVQMSVDDELEPVMGEGEDIGYGIDSYGETIDESTVSELYRIAEKEILPNTELAQIDPYVSIDEDSWDFYFGGVSNTGMMGVVKFYIHFKLTSDNIDLNEYVLPDAKLYPDFRYYTASLDFDIYTENGKVTDVVLESADIYKSDNSYDTYQSDKFKEAFNVEAIENYIEKLAAPAVEEIYNAVSNL